MIKTASSGKRWKFLYWSLVLALFGLVIYRSANIPFFSDEVSSFFRYIRTGQIWPFQDYPNANNHVLNSLLSRWSFLLFGSSPWALRLPNTLSFLLLAGFIWRMGSEVGRLSSVFILLALCSSLFFLSFFSLTRGYGMSMAFLIGLFYYTLHVFTIQNNWSLLGLGITGSLAVWSNLSLLAPVGLSYLLVFIWVIRHRKLYHPWYAGLSTLVMAIPFVFAVQLALQLKQADQLYHGTAEGFYDAIILRFSEEIGFGYAHPEYGVWIFGSMILVTFIYGWIRNSLATEDWVLLTLFLGNLFGLFLLNKVLGGRYPLDRALLYLYPIFILLLIIPTIRIWKSPGMLIPCALVLCLLPHYLSPASYAYSPHWRYEHTPYSFNEQATLWAEEHGRYPSLSAHGLNGRTWDFNSFLADNATASYQEQQFPSAAADLILTYHWHKDYPIKLYDTVAYSTNTKMALLQRKHYNRLEYLKPRIVQARPWGNDGFVLGSYPVASLDQRYGQVEINLKMRTDAKPYQGNLAIRARGDSGQVLSESILQLYRMPGYHSDEYIIRRTLFTEIREAQSLELVLLNPHAQAYEVLGGKIQLRVFD